MSNLPNSSDKVKVFENEYCNSTSLNRPLHRLHQNDLYLESIISNYLNRPILPFQDFIVPPTFAQENTTKEWTIGDIKKDRGLTFQYVLNDGDNFRHANAVITYNNEDLHVSETFHETPHNIGLVEVSYYINDDGLIQLKIVSTNPKRLVIIGEVINNIPISITNVDASRYAFYRNNAPELEGVHVHDNLDVLNRIRGEQTPGSELLYLNAQGEYTEIQIKNPTSHNHTNLDMLRMLINNENGNYEVFNTLTNTGDGSKLLADNGEYISTSGVHTHPNLSFLNSLTFGASHVADGVNIVHSPTKFLNERGEYININLNVIHGHSNLPELASIANNGMGNLDVLNILANDKDGTRFLNDNGQYVHIDMHNNIDALNNVTAGGSPNKFLSEYGTYRTIPIDNIHIHNNMGILNMIGTGDDNKFLSQSGDFIEIEPSLPAGSIIMDASQPVGTDANGNPIFEDKEGFLACDGSEVSRAIYFELFTAIGTTYGEGTDEVTFNLPDIPNMAPTIRYVIRIGKYRDGRD